MFVNDPRFNGINRYESRVWLSSPTMHGEEKKWVDHQIEANWVSTVGENLNQIEREIAEFTGSSYAVALSSGTSALHLAVKLAGEKAYGRPKSYRGTLHGHRVFCSDMTFYASANPIVYEGGDPIFIDTEYDTWNMCPEALEKAFELYPDVKLIVLVHLYGTPAKIDEIRKIAEKHHALIVEDAAESFGSLYKNNGLWQQTGTFGSYNMISFNGNKIITGSSGGMFLTNNKDDADRVRKWSTQSREKASWYQHEEIGYNYRMSNIIAGIIRGQLPYLNEHISQKKAIYERYKEGLKDLPVSMNPFDAEKSIPNHWLSCMIIDKEAMCSHSRNDREALYVTEPGKSCPSEILDALNEYNFEGRPIWKPMHLQPIYYTCPFITIEGYGKGRSNLFISMADEFVAGKNVLDILDDAGGGVFVGAGVPAVEGNGIDVGADIFNRGLCLPSDNKMTVEQQDIIIDIIHRCFK